ncbi:hypothetical protein AMAG_15208 [Allomyces macrogynus ATCC 38327]|uniref:Uncharacterized protein n=1 Tax=Allomyces macrogynus (strain ATCC 38327) TaxID=578462 RepID=A0A0L0T811_ALLM3|nr:hypothetical protein AMAG_15208 [Allomyces macrogynus ATCC 38327]|eukprot:KNE70943.1 hypothetical protein AMAG_15208 [Allomyces macrogynus ATCC 38327]
MPLPLSTRPSTSTPTPTPGTRPLSACNCRRPSRGPVGSTEPLRHGRMVTFGDTHERTFSDDGVDRPSSGMSRSSSSSNLPHKRIDSAWSPVTPAETRCPSPACGMQPRVTVVVDTEADAVRSTPLMTPDPSPLIVAHFRSGRAASVQDTQSLPAFTCTTRSADRTDDDNETVSLPPGPKLGNILTLDESALHADSDPFPWSLLVPRAQARAEFDAECVASTLPAAPKAGETLVLDAAVLREHPPEPFPWALLAPRRSHRGAEPADIARLPAEAMDMHVPGYHCAPLGA